MGIFEAASKGLDEYSVTGGRIPTLTIGNYVVEITEQRRFVTRSKIETHKTEFKVVESNNAEHPVGSTREYTIWMNGDYVLADVKKLLLACKGLSPTSAADAAEIAKTKWFSVLEDSISAKQPFKGVRIGIDVEAVESKKSRDARKLMAELNAKLPENAQQPVPAPITSSVPRFKPVAK